MVVALFGCAQHAAIKQTNMPLSTTKQVETTPSSKPKINPRVAYLKDGALAMGYKLENFYEMDNLFGVVKALQDGKITTSDLSDAMLYFNDNDGYDSGYLYNSTYFKCLQVIELGEMENDSGENISLYKALYTNSQIDMTVTVIWAGTMPLKGQKLNVDFLTYGESGTYKNIKNEDRAEVIFWRPRWAGSNGYTYY
jgi:hypothetical protein